MQTIWLLYMLVSFNGDPQLQIEEYDTEEECQEEKERILEEIKDVYDIDNAQLYCILSAKKS